MPNQSSRRTINPITLKRFFVQYLDYRSFHVRASSISQAKTVYRKYLSEYESCYLKEAFHPSKVKGYYNKIINDASLAPSWKNRIIGVIRSMLGVAYKTRHIDAFLYQDDLAILENVPENRGAKEEKQIWTKKEEEAFLAVITNERDKVMFRLFISLGARIGEFLGLTWDCFDAKRGCIEIRQQLLYNSQKTYVLSTVLKTRESYRTCKLDQTTKQMLLEYKKSAPESKFLFCSTSDASLPLSKARFRKLMDHYIALSKVKRITPHGVRHGKATKLMKACRNMLEVKASARFMGHSTAIMMDVYSHSEETTINTIIRRMEKEE